MLSSSDFLLPKVKAVAPMAAGIDGFKRSSGEAYGFSHRFVLEVNGLTIVEGFRAYSILNL